MKYALIIIAILIAAYAVAWYVYHNKHYSRTEAHKRWHQGRGRTLDEIFHRINKIKIPIVRLPLHLLKVKPLKSLADREELRQDIIFLILMILLFVFVLIFRQKP